MFQASEPGSWLLGVAAVIVAILVLILWLFISNLLSDFKEVRVKIEDHDSALIKLKTLEIGRNDVLEQIRNGIDGLNNKLEKALDEIKHLTIEHEKMKAKCELHHRG